MGEVDVSRGNPNQCSILKSSTPIKYHFGHQKVLFFVFWGHFTKMCFAKFPPFIVKASSKNACHKIYWQQFVNRNIDGLQSWYSNRHFQIPITHANSGTSIRHWLQLRLGKHNYMWTWIFQKHWVKIDRKSIETWNIGCIDASIIMRSSDGKYGLG